MIFTKNGFVNIAMVALLATVCSGGGLIRTEYMVMLRVSNDEIMEANFKSESKVYRVSNGIILNDFSAKNFSVFDGSERKIEVSNVSSVVEVSSEGKHHPSLKVEFDNVGRVEEGELVDFSAKLIFFLMSVIEDSKLRKTFLSPSLTREERLSFEVQGGAEEMNSLYSPIDDWMPFIGMTEDEDGIYFGFASEKMISAVLRNPEEYSLVDFKDSVIGSKERALSFIKVTFVPDEEDEFDFGDFLNGSD